MIRLLAVALLTVLLTACGSAEAPTPTPTKTPLPPTEVAAALVPLTDTPTPVPPVEPAALAPTETPIPATAVPVETPLPVPTDTLPAPTAVAAEEQPDRAAAVPLGDSGAVVITALDKDAEYVDVQNQGAAAVDLARWRLLSVKGAQECWLSGTIQAGETLRIWSQTGDGGFSCQYDGNIWNNSESDPAELYDAAGNLVSTW